MDLRIPAPDGTVDLKVEPLLNDSGEVFDSSAPFPAQDHTATATHIALTNGSTSVVAGLFCEACAESLLQGEGDVLFGA